MSVISNTHSVVPFDSATSKPAEGQRLAKIGYKQTEAMTKRGEKALGSVCVSVPQILEVTEAQIESLAPYITKMLEDAQDSIVRRKHSEAKGNITHVRDDEITIECCIAELELQSTSSRLSKESVTAWCETSGLNDALRLRFAELLGVSDVPTAEENARVEAQVAAYDAMFASLSGAKTYFAPTEAKKLRKALEIGAAYGVDDALSVRFSTRIDEMITNPKDSADLLAL